MRAQAIARDGGKCRLCDSSDNLEVHHRRYPPGDQWHLDSLDALTTLCYRCHRLVTSDQWRQRRAALEDRRWNNLPNLEDPGIARAAAAAGSKKALAEALGVTKSNVTQWKRIPAKHVPTIASLYGLKRVELRPDIYGPMRRRRRRKPINRSDDSSYIPAE